MKEIFRVLNSELLGLRRAARKWENLSAEAQNEKNKYEQYFKQSQKDYCDLANAVHTLHKVSPINFEFLRSKIGRGIAENSIKVLNDLVKEDENCGA